MGAPPTTQVVFDHYEPEEEARRESLLGLGNGVLFVRACAPEAAFAAPGEGSRHYPGLYLAGGYNRAEREAGGERVPITALVNLPHPFGLSFRIDGEDAWFSLDDLQLLHYRHRLDMASGIAEREAVTRDAAGRETRLLETRLVSQADESLALLRWCVTPLNWSGEVTVRARLHTAPRNTKLERNRAYEGRHLDVQPLPVEEGAAVLALTTDGARRVRVHARLRCGDGTPSVERGVQGDALFQQYGVQARVGVSFDAELQVNIEADDAAGGPAKAALAATQTDRASNLDQHFAGVRDEPGGTPGGPAAAPSPVFSPALAAHCSAWQSLWQRVQIAAPRDTELERGCRFNAFHLLQTASPLSCRRATGLPARGWQEGYFGHVFWDELFAFPFYSLRLPEIARSLLEYRWRRLSAARDTARRAGRQGALFPWRSAATGEEETPHYQWIPPARRWKADHTRLQHHIGAAIAFSIWNHHLATGDRELLVSHTGEMLIDIARFWASLAEPGAAGRYEIRGVIGPDEYHDAYPGAERPGVDNNAYTNLMAAWSLRCAAELREHLRAEEWRALGARAGVQPQEPEQWDRVSRRLALPLCEGDTGAVIAQFEGFDRLLPVSSAPLSERERNEREDWWLFARGDDVNRYQIAKQADVLMLFHLLGHGGVSALVERLGLRVAEGWCERTVAYYMQRISHESSLSRIVCAGALAECDREASWRYYRQALHTDLGTGASASTHEGVHLGAMAGCWDVLQRFYLGLRVEPGQVAIEPCPPDALDDVRTTVWLRGGRLELHLQGRHLHLALDGSAPSALALRFRGERLELQPGGSFALACR